MVTNGLASPLRSRGFATTTTGASQRAHRVVDWMRQTHTRSWLYRFAPPKDTTAALDHDGTLVLDLDLLVTGLLGRSDIPGSSCDQRQAVSGQGALSPARPG